MNTARRFPLRSIANLPLSLPDVILTCVVFILCYQGARLAFVLGIPPDQTPSFWPPTAILLAVVLLVPTRIWTPLIAAGVGAMALADFRDGVSIGPEIWLSLGCITEAFIALLGISRLFRGAPQLTNAKALAKYLVAGVILAPLVSAFVGAISSVPGGYWVQWRLRFFSDALAYLTLTPAILTWYRAGRAWVNNPRNFLELACLMSLLSLFGYLAFIAGGERAQPALLYSLVPLLLWAALRLGLKGVSTSIVVVALLSIWGAAHGRGPFSDEEPRISILSLQLFLFFAAMPFMFLAVLVEDRKQAADTLRESEQRFRYVANTAPVVIWMAGPDKLCTYVNQVWLNFTGRPLEAELGYGWAEGIHPEDRQACVEGYTRAFDRREPFTSEYRLRRHDGEYRWILDSSIPRFEADGSFAGYIGSAVDVTDRKRAEETLSNLSGRLIEAQEAERHYIARELHDDVSQKLALLCVEMHQFSSALLASQAKLANRLHSLIGQISEIGGDVHALSHRLHSSKLETLGLVTTMRGFCRELAEQRDVKIEFTHNDVPSELPPQVPLYLFRILQEGLSNAVKHSGARQFEVRLARMSDQLQLTIRDPGVGFDPGMAMYTHGLGLISMRERVNLLKGRISIVSKPQGGTEIQVRVPLTARTDIDRKAASAS